MRSLIATLSSVAAIGAAHAGVWVPRSIGVPTLGEFGMVGLAVAVGVVGGKLIGKRRK
jgi:hypothetical protein